MNMLVFGGFGGFFFVRRGIKHFIKRNLSAYLESSYNGHIHYHIKTPPRLGKLQFKYCSTKTADKERYFFIFYDHNVIH